MPTSQPCHPILKNNSNSSDLNRWCRHLTQSKVHAPAQHLPTSCEVHPMHAAATSPTRDPTDVYKYCVFPRTRRTSNPRHRPFNCFNTPGGAKAAHTHTHMHTHTRTPVQDAVQASNHPQLCVLHAIQETACSCKQDVVSLGRFKPAHWTSSKAVINFAEQRPASNRGKELTQASADTNSQSWDCLCG
jgi:hypothetical protein